MKIVVMVFAVLVFWSICMVAGSYASETPPVAADAKKADKVKVTEKQPTSTTASSDRLTESEALAFGVAMEQAKWATDRVERLRTEISLAHNLTQKDSFDYGTRIISRNVNPPTAVAKAEHKAKK